MKRTQWQDPFFLNQPPLRFVDDLCAPVHMAAPERYGTRPMEEGEVDVRGLYIAQAFDADPDGLLETVYRDFQRFTVLYGIAGDRFPIRLCRGITPCFEAHRIEVTPEGITVTAADTEGIRRGLIRLEDDLRRSEAHFLTPGITERRPYIHTRITRCFFSPTNRPPKNGDELSDEVDYYPEEYLNRLMHDGTNAVWIYSRFSDLIPSEIITEYGQGHEKRIAKLNRVIEKCARYGIQVFLFAIEPFHLSPELVAKYPDMAGTPTWSGWRAFCTRSPRGKAFMKEMARNLTKLAPKLAGLISITYGERPTACSSMGGPFDGGITCPHTDTCPGCAQRSTAAILSESIDTLRAGFREVNPGFRVVSWTYGHRLWEFDPIREYVRTAPDDVMLMQNFDDMAYEEQLGKTRLGVDYWLSYPGPSDLFRITAQEANAHGKHLFAKMQVCCSHEVASVPYIPVPGILWDKYKGARQYGVEGVMQCWYFGNYPSMMSKVAGELSFEEKFEDEDAFLRSIAAISWGRSKADAVVKAWKWFEKSYRQYPLNVMFSYYGPMHDSVVWELQLEPKNFQTPRSWFTLDNVDGDRICDSLQRGHTLEEAWILCSRMSEDWANGLAALEQASALHADETELVSVSGALDLLIRGSRDILEFYLLRDRLGQGDTAVLDRMELLVKQEIGYSEAMIPLCEADGRLGYHSEAEGYKFFPEKLRHRIEKLQTLLETEFPRVRARIAAGLPPLAYYAGEEDLPGQKRYTLNNQWEPIGDPANSRFRAEVRDGALVIELESPEKVTFTLCPEYRLCDPDAVVRITPEGDVTHDGYFGPIYSGLFGPQLEIELGKYRDRVTLPGEGAHHILTLPLEKLGLARIRPMKMKICANGHSWCRAEDGLLTLAKPELIPEHYGWWLPKE